MKTTILFSLVSILCIFSANSAPDPVLDAFWKNLLAGAEYYAMPAAQDSTGGIILAAVGNKSCADGVAQFTFDEYIGLPLTFTPVNPKKGVIRLSTDLNIKFSGSSICNESNVWKLKYDKTIKQYAVMVGGVEGNPGPKTLDNWFKIEKTLDGYKFVFCPSVCSNCKVMCRDVGLALDGNGVQRLVLSDKPHTVIFYKK